MFYSNSTKGFYSFEIHGDKIPNDAVEISNEHYENLLLGQSNGKIIAVNDSGVPILVDYLPVSATKFENKSEAVRRLAETDWVNQPDVYDPANIPRLTNRDVFIAYRLQIRAIAVSPIDGNLDWPIQPTAVWSS